MGLSDRIRELFKRTKNLPQLSSSVIDHDRLDDGVLEDMIERALHFRHQMFDRPDISLDNLEDDEGNPIELTDEQREKAEQYAQWPELFKDMFLASHTLDGPELRPPDECKPHTELHRRIMQQYVNSDAFQKLRPDTRHDELASMIACLEAAPRMQDTLSTELREFVVRTMQMAENEEEIESAQEQLDALREQAANQPGGCTQAQKDAMKQAAKQKSQARHDLAQQQAQQQTAGMSPAAMQAIEEAVEDAQEAATAISNLPGTEPGSGVQLPPDQMIELAKKCKNNPELFKFLEMCGRLKSDIRYKRANRVIGGREEIVDVTTGNDIALLLPHEKVKLRHPLLRRDWMKRFYEEDLAQYEMQGYAEAGRGPVIPCLDGSGSMGGMPNVWARGLAMALVTNARREKRDAAIVEFSSTGQVMRWDFFAKEPLNPLKVIDFATHMFNGGTDITTGVESAKELIDVVPEFRTADIVLMTDGYDNYREDDEALRAELVGRGVRVHGVAIGMEASQNEYLQKMCESVVSAWDLAGSNEAVTHLAEAIT